MSLLSVGFLQGSGIIANGAVVSNPNDQDVLVDTGALNKGNYLFAITGSCSVAWVYDIQIRNALNDTTLYSFVRRPAAGNEDFFAGFKIPMDTGQRLRCIDNGGHVGAIQLSIIYGEVG